MSAFDLQGTGELYCQDSGITAAVQLNIKPVNGRTKIHCISIENNQSLNFERLAFSGNVLALKNVRISSAAGLLTSDLIPEVYMNYMASSNEEEPQLVTQLTKGPENVHTLNFASSYLELSSSALQFKLDTKESATNCQVMFIGAAQNIKGFRISTVLADQIIKIQSYSNTHPTLAGLIVAEFDDKLDYKNQTNLRLSLELFLRQKLSFLAEIEHKKAEINLVDHSTGSYSPINSMPNYSFKQIKEYVQKNPDYHAYFRFLIELVGNSGVVDDRLLNGFVALEALFKGTKLHKDRISQELKISLETAELIKKLRDKMFHHGASIKDAINIIYEEKQKHSKAKLNPILKLLVKHSNISSFIYTSFTDLMFSHFADLVGLNSNEIKRWSEIDLRQNGWHEHLK
ncbi:MAG: hypothetical protein CMP47_07445 [Rickettsiales bacterium]|nr:hypothetical protein [Rickettsiales bacterium]